MKPFIYKFVFTKCFFIPALLISSMCQAGNVGGVLFGVGTYGQYPAQRVPVTLFSQGLGRSGASYSDYQGNYYLNNIPPGQYMLEIWSNPNRPITFPITVYNQPYTQLPRYRVY